MPHLLRGGRGHGAPCPRVRQCGGGRHGRLHEQRQGARGAPHEPAPHPLTPRYIVHELHAKRQLHLAAAGERLQHARHALPQKAAARGGGLFHAAHSRERQVRAVPALHPGVRKRAEREDLGPSRHGLAHGRGRIVQPPHSRYRVHVLRPVHHPLPDGGAARARRHGPCLRRDRRSERRHRGAGRARGARGMGRAVRARQRVRNAQAHGRGAARAGLQLCVRHRLCRRPHDHGGRQRVYRALHPQGPVSVADVHVLLPGLGSLCEVPVPRTDGQSLHGQVAPADVRRGGEELLCRKGRHRPQAPFCRLNHAVRVEKERMCAADDEERRGRPRCRREHHDARAEHYDARESH